MVDDYEYNVVITRRKRNPEYHRPSLSDVYHQSYDDPKGREFIEVTEMSTVLSEKEFNAVRKAVIESMP